MNRAVCSSVLLFIGKRLCKVGKAFDFRESKLSSYTPRASTRCVFGTQASVCIERNLARELKVRINWKLIKVLAE